MEVTHICCACPLLRLTFVSGLAASLGYGAASELLRRSTTSPTDSAGHPSSLMMTEANLTRLVSKLTRMRGAALKVGQFLSIQGSCSSVPYSSINRGLTCCSADTHVLPPELDRVFRRVQDSAHYMPNWQMEVRPAFFHPTYPSWTDGPPAELTERDDDLPRSRVALLLRGFQPYSLRGGIDRAGPSRDARSTGFPNRPA
jgi:hypothetical protein